jgi:hypothetical protein
MFLWDLTLPWYPCSSRPLVECEHKAWGKLRVGGHAAAPVVWTRCCLIAVCRLIIAWKTFAQSDASFGAMRSGIRFECLTHDGFQRRDFIVCQLFETALAALCLREFPAVLLAEPDKAGGYGIW